MDALKNATNTDIGKTTTSQQSGEEPVSGEKGAGTTTEPFDQGNAAGMFSAPTPEAEVDGGKQENIQREKNGRFGD